MKKVLVLGLVFILLLPVLAAGCKTEESATSGGPAKTIVLTLDDFTAQNNIVKDIEMARSGSLTVSLGSNPTTGYQWGEAEISDTAVTVQASHNFVKPQSTSSEPVVGAPGKDVWTFDAKAAGTATIKMSYSRPWESGAKDTYTLTINITVK
jgi:inhibitor of cysteine peptidase